MRKTLIALAFVALIITGSIGDAAHKPSNFYESWESGDLSGYTVYNDDETWIYSEVIQGGTHGNYVLHQNATEGIFHETGSTTVVSNRTFDFSYHNGTLMSFDIQIDTDIASSKETSPGSGTLSGSGSPFTLLNVTDNSGNSLEFAIQFLDNGQNEIDSIDYRLRGSTVNFAQYSDGSIDADNTATYMTNGFINVTITYHEPDTVNVYLDGTKRIETQRVGTFTTPKQTQTFIQTDHFGLTTEHIKTRYDDIHIGNVSIRPFEPTGEQPNNPQQPINNPAVTFLELLNVREIQFIAIAAVLSAGVVEISGSSFAGCVIFPVLIAMGYAAGFTSFGVTASSILIMLVILINLRNVAYLKR